MRAVSLLLYLWGSWVWMVFWGWETGSAVLRFLIPVYSGWESEDGLGFASAWLDDGREQRQSGQETKSAKPKGHLHPTHPRTTHPLTTPAHSHHPSPLPSHPIHHTKPILTHPKAARIKRTPGLIKFKVRCKRYLYTLSLKDSDKADKLKQSLPPSKSFFTLQYFECRDSTWGCGYECGVPAMKRTNVIWQICR